MPLESTPNNISTNILLMTWMKVQKDIFTKFVDAKLDDIIKRQKLSQFFKANEEAEM